MPVSSEMAATESGTSQARMQAKSHCENEDRHTFPRRQSKPSACIHQLFNFKPSTRPFLNFNARWPREMAENVTTVRSSTSQHVINHAPEIAEQNDGTELFPLCFSLTPCSQP